MRPIPLASTLSNVAPSRIRELADVAFGMEGVYKLHFGESDMPTPRYIKDAAVRALDEGYTFYTENAGLPGLREALAAKYADVHGATLAPGEILITASGVQALNVSIRCVIDPGDEAIVLTPNWPNAAAIVNLFGGNSVEIPLVRARDRYRIDFNALESARNGGKRSCSPLRRRPIRSAGSSRHTNSGSFWTSAAATASGSSPTKSTSIFATTVPSRLPFCGCATETTL